MTATSRASVTRLSAEVEQTLYDHAPVAYLVVARGLIQRANLAALDLFGRDREALVGHPLVAFLDPTDMPAMLEHLRACGADGVTRSLEVDLGTAGGPRRVLFTSRGGQEAGDDAPACFVTAVDVTAQRRAERIAVRLADLANAGWLPLDEATVRIAQLALPDLADLCVLDLVEGGAVRPRAALEHCDPEKGERFAEAEERWGLLPNVSYARLQALMTRQLQVIPVVTPDYFGLAAADGDHLEALVRLVLRSWVVVPLVDPADDAVLGVLRLATAGIRTFEAPTLTLVEEFGRIAAMSLIRARQQTERLAESRRRVQRMSSASQALEETSRGLARLNGRGPGRTLPQLVEDLKTIAKGLKDG